MVYITLLEETRYTVVFESGGVSSQFVLVSNGPAEYPTEYPKGFTPSGTVKVTVYDSSMNEVCSLDYEAN